MIKVENGHFTCLLEDNGASLIKDLITAVSGAAKIMRDCGAPEEEIEKGLVEIIDAGLTSKQISLEEWQKQCREKGL